jgi:hypothetical protein
VFYVFFLQGFFLITSYYNYALAYPSLLFNHQLSTWFPRKPQGSKTTSVSSLATVVSDSDNGEGMDLAAVRCRAHTQAQNYNDRWVIFMGTCTCKRTGHKGKREKGALENQASMLRCSGNQTERRQPVPPVSRKASPSAWGEVKPDVKPPAKAVGDTLTRASGGRDRVFGDFKLEGLDAAQMNDLGGVTDEILAAQMEILSKNEVSESGKTPWVNIRMMRSHFLEKGLTTLQRQSSKLGP